MAVEIKELIIKAIAVDNNVSTQTPTNVPMVDTEEMTKKIVQQCVKEVLKIMERKITR